VLIDARTLQVKAINNCDGIPLGALMYVKNKGVSFLGQPLRLIDRVHAATMTSPIASGMPKTKRVANGMAVPSRRNARSTNTSAVAKERARMKRWSRYPLMTVVWPLREKTMTGSSFMAFWPC
jgi:hypothetical protein